MAKMVHFTKSTTTLKGFAIDTNGTVTQLASLLVMDTVKSLETAKKLLADANGLNKAVVMATEIIREEKHYEIPLEIFEEFAVERKPQRVRKAKED